jgi:hypothetical protein
LLWILDEETSAGGRIVGRDRNDRRGVSAATAFNGNSNLGIAPNKYTALVGAADIIIHF